VFSSDPTAARAVLGGRMAHSGETPLADLPLSGGALGGTGALAVGAERLWLAQPQLLGGPSVASVPLAEVGAVSCRPRRTRSGGTRITLEISGRRVDLVTPAGADEVSEFLRTLESARG
jgi:hypothetical protein